jgi:transposase-like protein
MGKARKKFSDEVKRKAVEDYVSGRRSAAQVATELETSPGQVYSWRTQVEEKAKGTAIDDLVGEGRSRADALLIMQLKAERDAYQSTVGEQTVIIELLKKRLQSTSLAQRSALTGLIETLEKSVQKRKPGKL